MQITMPGISIDVDGMRIATIGLEGMQVANVSVHGALDRLPLAVLSAHGGNYEEGGCGHLIWVTEHALAPGAVLSVRLNAGGGTGDAGKTLDELYPGHAPCTRTDFTLSDEMAAEIRARPRLHDAFTVQVNTSAGQQALAGSDDANTDFTLSLLWDNHRPGQLRLRLATYCLDDVQARTGGTEHLLTALSLGESVSFSLLR